MRRNGRESTYETSGVDAISEQTSTGRRGQTWALLRLGAGALVLVVLLLRLGAGPFVDGLRLTDAWSLLAATALTAITTVCCAWRWRLVSESLGVPLEPGAALAAVYRAQFLNATLPGGVVGDVDRALGHRRGGGIVGAGVRSVVWERTMGQVVQLLLTGVLLAVLPSSVQGVGVAATVTGGVLLAGAVLLGPLRPRGMPGPAASVLRADLRAIATGRGVGAGVVVASAAAVTGHLLVLLLAARVAGVTVGPDRILPLAAVVLLASAVPLNVAGWGPREGVAAWAFAAAGLGASTGLTTAVVYGVMTLVATLPGALVLLAGRRWPATAAAPLPVPVLEEAPCG